VVFGVGFNKSGNVDIPDGGAMQILLSLPAKNTTRPHPGGNIHGILTIGHPA